MVVASPLKGQKQRTDTCDVTTCQNDEPNYAFVMNSLIAVMIRSSAEFAVNHSRLF
jgi:hypothetical protein